MIAFRPGYKQANMSAQFLCNIWQIKLAIFEGLKHDKS